MATSLNGGKTRPMSRVALETLARVRIAPIPAQEINPGVVDRLLREGCVELVDLPSPYRTVRRPVTLFTYLYNARVILDAAHAASGEPQK